MADARFELPASRRPLLAPLLAWLIWSVVTGAILALAGRIFEGRLFADGILGLCYGVWAWRRSRHPALVADAGQFRARPSHPIAWSQVQLVCVARVFPHWIPEPFQLSTLSCWSAANLEYAARGNFAPTAVHRAIVWSGQPPEHVIACLRGLAPDTVAIRGPVDRKNLVHEVRAAGRPE